MTSPQTFKQDRAQAQQALVQSIQARRLRWRQQSQARASWQAPSASDATNAPLWAQVAVFARQHPVVACALAAGAVALGPRRLLRWAMLALPWVLPNKR